MQASALYVEIEQKLGTNPPPDCQFNGEFVRWGHNKKFWLVAKQYGPHVYATYGDWSTGATYKWSSNTHAGATRAQHEEIHERVQREQESNLKLYQGYFESIINACAMMEPNKCPYAFNKDIPAHEDLYVVPEETEINKIEINPETKRLVKVGTRVLWEGTLVVPIKAKNGIRGIQLINPDGDKEFLRGSQIKGGYFTFGRLDLSHHVYVCEGIGTAGAIASAFEGKDVSVVCAFNCGNMAGVVHEIRALEPLSKIVIAADNDDPGIDAAMAIEKSYKNVIVRCPKKEGQDFADIPIKERRQFLNVDRTDFINIKSLGFTDSTYYFFSSYKNGITKCGMAITKPYILDLAPFSFWYKEYPNKTGGIDQDACSHHLKEISRDQGQFDPTKLRGSGYFECDDGLYAASFGRTFRGSIKDMVHITGKKIYVPKEIETKQITKLKKNVQVLTDAVSSFCWSNKLHGKLLMGWVLSAPFSGALPFRPHMWITGDSSSGKSWVRAQIVKPLLGDNVYDFTGDSTEAGIRAALKYDALPIMLDEFESEDMFQKKRRQRTLELLRQASSETNSTIVKSSGDGNAVIYKIVTSAILFSVRSSLDFEANRNRFITLSFNKEKQDGQNFQPISEMIQNSDLNFVHQKNIDYLFSEWPLFMSYYKKCYNALRGHMNDHLNRCFSVVNAALSMYDIPMVITDIIQLQKGLSEFIVEEKINCLNHLISAELKERGVPQGTPLEIVSDMRDGDRECNVMLRKILRKNGLKYDLNIDTLEINIKHPNVLKIMSNYPDGNWAKSLISVPNASYKKDKSFYIDREDGMGVGGRGGVIEIGNFYTRFGNR